MNSSPADGSYVKVSAHHFDLVPRPRSRLLHARATPVVFRQEMHRRNY